MGNFNSTLEAPSKADLINNIVVSVLESALLCGDATAVSTGNILTTKIDVACLKSPTSVLGWTVHENLTNFVSTKLQGVPFLPVELSKATREQIARASLSVDADQLLTALRTLTDASMVTLTEGKVMATGAAVQVALEKYAPWVNAVVSLQKELETEVDEERKKRKYAIAAVVVAVMVLCSSSSVASVIGRSSKSCPPTAADPLSGLRTLGALRGLV